MGYFHARPKDWEGATRAEVWGLRGQRVEIPDAGEDWRIWEAFTSLGCAAPGGFGPVPLTFVEIAAFDTSGRLDEWSRTTLRRMSLAYLEGLDAGKDVMCMPPAEWDQPENPQ